MIRIGCSGWQYADWRLPVYGGAPPATWFDRYAERFDTVELNATFYRLPDPATVDRWARRAPAGFLYAVKLGQFGSHRMKLRDAASWLPNHVDRLERLGQTAGPTLVQLPPRWRVDAGRLDEFLAAWPGDRFRCAVELRDPSWLCDEVMTVLRDHGAALCLHDLLPGHPWELTTDWTYLRFHGVSPTEAPYRGRYGPDRLDAVARRLDEWIAAGIDVHAYFNNDHEAHAVADAQWLRRRLGGAAPQSEGFRPSTPRAGSSP